MDMKLVQAVRSSTLLQDNSDVQSVLADYVGLVGSNSFEELRLAALSRHLCLQRAEIDRPVDDAALLVAYEVCHRLNYDETVWNNIEIFHGQLRGLFPSNRYTLTHRVLGVEQVTVKQQKNGLRVHFDTVGFRLTAQNPLDLIAAMHRLEQSGLFILFRFNTYPFSQQEYRQRIGPNSSPSYRAVHYYVLVGTVIAEIQLRTTSVSVWSEIHHCTLYKPTRIISSSDSKGITALGEIANIVDLSRMLQ